LLTALREQRSRTDPRICTCRGICTCRCICSCRCLFYAVILERSEGSLYFVLALRCFRRPTKTQCHPASHTRTQTANLSAARAFLLASSSSRSLGGAFVSSDASRRADTKAISSTAESNDASFAFEGFVNPLIFLTNWSEASRISSSVTGGSKLNKVLIFLHIRHTPRLSQRSASGF
jgi:hypothetical protein